MSASNEVDEALSCTFCREKFKDIIKLIPECGNSICGRCCEHLCADVNEDDLTYKCSACNREHALQELPENKQLLRLIQRLPERQLLENAKTLRMLVKEVEHQMEKLHSFNAKETIELECERIEQEVSDAIDSAVEHLKQIETNMLKQISEYRERCLVNISEKSCCSENETKLEMNILTKEVGEFSAKWNDYFERIEAYEKASDIEAAIAQTSEYISAMQLIEEKMRKEAFNCELLVFMENSQFLKKWDHVGEIEIIPQSIGTTETIEKTEETPGIVLIGHSGCVNQVLFLSDGKLASCSFDEKIKIWDSAKGKELFELAGHEHSVQSIAALSNGNLVSCSKDKTIRIWSLNKKKEKRTIKVDTELIFALRLLSNGNLAAYFLDDSIRIWSLDSNEQDPILIIRGHGNTSRRLSLFDAMLCNDYLVTCSCDEYEKKECVLRVWSGKKGHLIQSINTGFNDAQSLAVLADDYVALGFASGAIRLIHLNDQALSKTIKRAHDKWVSSLAQLSSKDLISSGIDDTSVTIKLWSWSDLNMIRSIHTEHSNWIVSLSISSDEKLLASGGSDSLIECSTLSMSPIQVISF